MNNLKFLLLLLIKIFCDNKSAICNALDLIKWVDVDGDFIEEKIYLVMICNLHIKTK